MSWPLGRFLKGIHNKISSYAKLWTFFQGIIRLSWATFNWVTFQGRFKLLYGGFAEDLNLLACYAVIIVKNCRRFEWFYFVPLEGIWYCLTTKIKAYGSSVHRCLFTSHPRILKTCSFKVLRKMLILLGWEYELIKI